MFPNEQKRAVLRWTTVWVFALAATGPVWSDQYVVDTEADIMATGCSGVVIGDCSLRGAIQRANQNFGTDTITFGFGANEFDLTIVGADEDLNQIGDLDILEDVGILGGAGVVINGSLIDDRVFDVQTGTTDLTAFQNLTITGGSTPPGANFFKGGGIRCFGSGLLLDNVLLIDNGPVDDGGGLFADSCNMVFNFTTVASNTATNRGGGVRLEGSNPTLSAPLSAFVGNQAVTGGAVSLSLGAELHLDNATLSGNMATESGTAIHSFHANVELDFVTVVSPFGTPALFHVGAGVTTLSNSLISGTCSGTAFATLGGNLENPGNSCGLDSNIDLTDVPDPRLMPLTTHGSHIPFHMPHSDSPAVDDPQGSITNCPGHDQRFSDRPIDGNGDGQTTCDIGAIERDIAFQDGFESGNTSKWSLTVP